MNMWPLFYASKWMCVRSFFHFNDFSIDFEGFLITLNIQHDLKKTKVFVVFESAKKTI